ncbi:hypothetical protein QJS10_CPB18g00161 [Acorus calamus]|uniref:Reverse transcriptase domain-containing protein n=1 Tax=Acorus calamus TaxID=4465 RepID=A0AAV9CNW3_ACOCL|nr:hypothetical protein QJS10_CPB18g00161 [Acorus calamus]
MLSNLRRHASNPVRVSQILSSLRSQSASASPSLSDEPSQPPPNPISKSELETLILNKYERHRFRDIVRDVVSSPPVLLSACRNLFSRSHGGGDPAAFETRSACDRLSIDELSLELKEDRFDVRARCVEMRPFGRKGEPLIVADLKLKVVMEAVRMALEVIYDKRFVTLSYGGRVGMGRHTAIRYLKSSVENPNWWFRVGLCRGRFGPRHVEKLMEVFAEKVDDRILLDLIVGFFDSGVVRFEFGGFCMGRGFPQESCLDSMLVNVYFHGLDREIQDLRLEIGRSNPRYGREEITDTGRVFYKPVKVYAVRYLDEILVITSGSKKLALNLKDRVVDYLEGNLGVNVDKSETAIHSAVSEKMEFIGMVLRAVTPSVLRPLMSEKATRARKKYLRQREMRALELKNARETIRKKLGLKIFNNLFKKLKRGKKFEFEYNIEDEVRDIFREWAGETVREFFGSQEECWRWHRKLTSGDFLSLKRIRDQLPGELVEAYDRFQENVDKYLMPGRPNKIFEEENIIEGNRGDEVEETDGDDSDGEQEDRRRYEERTVEDLTKLCMKVDAPIRLVREAVRMAGFTNSMGRPRPIELLCCLEDAEIVKWYAGVGKRWLDFFCCCHNFKMVKTIVNYHLRFSCILTLAEKHESTKREAIKHYTKHLKVSNGKVDEVHFPTEREIKMMGDRNLSDPMPVDGVLCLALLRLAFDVPSGSCVAHFCDREDTHIYRVRLLQNHLNVDPLNEKKWVKGMGVIHNSLNHKCLPLCSRHVSDLFLGRISLQDIDCTSYVDIP